MAGKADKFLCYLTDDGLFKLGYDSNQWILYRRSSEKRGVYRPISFIGSNIRILYRCMREAGCVPGPEAAALLKTFEPDFLTWLKERRGCPTIEV